MNSLKMLADPFKGESVTVKNLKAVPVLPSVRVRDSPLLSSPLLSSPLLSSPLLKEERGKRKEERGKRKEERGKRVEERG